MTIPLYQVDVFAQQLFQGNSAAVCPLPSWPSDQVLQQIALENNLSETAFFIADKQTFNQEAITLRWFSPNAEVDLCGHATLAAAHVLFKHYHSPQLALHFKTRSGTLTVEKNALGYQLALPTAPLKKHTLEQRFDDIAPRGLNAVYSDFDYLFVLDNEQQVKMFVPDYAVLKKLDKRGLIITAKGQKTDFVCRCFYPNMGIDEDPVTGSAHCLLVPYWARILNKKELISQQLSPRGGTVYCQLADDNVLLTGTVIDYLHGQIAISL